MPYLGPDERNLLLNCARLDLDGHVFHQTEDILQKPLAWDTLLLYAQAHSVAPLLHHHLKQFNGSGLIPPKARERLLHLSHRASYQNRQFSQALQDLLEVFAGAGVPVIVLKGLSLVELIYGNLALRPLIDLNLLIPREQLQMARRLVLRSGYHVRTRYPLRGIYRWVHSQLHLVKPRDLAVHLLLQWDVMNWPRFHAIDLRRFWDEARPARISGRDTLIPSPVDLVLYLCLQPDKYGYLNVPASHLEDATSLVFAEWTENSLIRFTDIYEAIKHYQGALDWDVLVERARASGIEGSVHASFWLITELFGQVIEPWVLDALRPPSPRGLRRWLFMTLANEPTDHPSASAVNAPIRAWWLRKQKSSQIRLMKLLSLLEFIFPRRDELRLRYRSHPEKATLAMYLAHLGKWLFRCALGFLPLLYCLVVKRRTVAILSGATPVQGAGRL